MFFFNEQLLHNMLGWCITIMHRRVVRFFWVQRDIISTIHDYIFHYMVVAIPVLLFTTMPWQHLYFYISWSPIRRAGLREG